MATEYLLVVYRRTYSYALKLYTWILLYYQQVVPYFLTQVIPKLLIGYSYLIASRGFKVEALRAGKIPVMYPTTAENIAIKVRNHIGK